MKKLQSFQITSQLSILAISLLGTATLATAATVKVPNAAVAQLVPKGWKVLAVSEGDLNKDQLKDVAMIIEKNKADVVVKNNEGKAIHNHPRQLLVFFKTPKSYQLMVSNKTIPVAETENSCEQDPLLESSHGVKINKGVLQVDFSYFMACGSWEWPRHFYTFRWQQQQFKLIGFDAHSFARNSGEETSSSYNFSTLKVKKTTGGNVFEGGKPKSQWESFADPKKLNLKNINFNDFYSQFNY